jgi:hypothetical protein
MSSERRMAGPVRKAFFVDEPAAVSMMRRRKMN